MSLEQFKRKQQQLDAEEADARKLQAVAVHIFENIERITELALRLVANAKACRDARDLERRLMNPAIFERILVTEEGIESAVLAWPFSDLLAEDFAQGPEMARADLGIPRNDQPPATFVGRRLE